MEEDKPRGADFYRAAARYGGVLVGTTTGLHLLFNAANRWVPGLEIGQVTGGWRDLRLKNIRYEQPGVAVTPANSTWRSSWAVARQQAVRERSVAKRCERGDRFEENAEVCAGRRRDSGPLNLSTPYPIALYRVALNNVNIKIDDTTVSVMDFTSGLRWQEKTSP
jgi:translocation and assembly module TamB